MLLDMQRSFEATFVLSPQLTETTMVRNSGLAGGTLRIFNRRDRNVEMRPQRGGNVRTNLIKIGQTWSSHAETLGLKFATGRCISRTWVA